MIKKPLKGLLSMNNKNQKDKIIKKAKKKNKMIPLYMNKNNKN